MSFGMASSDEGLGLTAWDSLCSRLGVVAKPPAYQVPKRALTDPNAAIMRSITTLEVANQESEEGHPRHNFVFQAKFSESANMEAVWDMMLNSAKTDLHLRAGSEGTFHVHKQVVAKHSAILYAEVNGNQKAKESTPYALMVVEGDEEALKTVIPYFYGKPITLNVCTPLYQKCLDLAKALKMWVFLEGAEALRDAYGETIQRMSSPESANSQPNGSVKANQDGETKVAVAVALPPAIKVEASTAGGSPLQATSAVANEDDDGEEGKLVIDDKYQPQQTAQEEPEVKKEDQPAAKRQRSSAPFENTTTQSMSSGSSTSSVSRAGRGKRPRKSSHPHRLNSSPATSPPQSPAAPPPVVAHAASSRPTLTIQPVPPCRTRRPSSATITSAQAEAAKASNGNAPPVLHLSSTSMASQMQQDLMKALGVSSMEALSGPQREMLQAVLNARMGAAASQSIAQEQQPPQAPPPMPMPPQAPEPNRGLEMSSAVAASLRVAREGQQQPPVPLQFPPFPPLPNAFARSTAALAMPPPPPPPPPQPQPSAAVASLMAAAQRPPQFQVPLPPCVALPNSTAQPHPVPTASPQELLDDVLARNPGQDGGSPDASPQQAPNTPSNRGRGNRDVRRAFDEHGNPVLGSNGKHMVECETCGKRLADPSSLYRHRKIHNNELDHGCPFCGNRFIQRYNMWAHFKVHNYHGVPMDMIKRVPPKIVPEMKLFPGPKNYDIVGLGYPPQDPSLANVFVNRQGQRRQSGQRRQPGQRKQPGQGKQPNQLMQSCQQEGDKQEEEEEEEAVEQEDLHVVAAPPVAPIAPPQQNPLLPADPAVLARMMIQMHQQHLLRMQQLQQQQQEQQGQGEQDDQKKQ